MQVESRFKAANVKTITDMLTALNSAPITKEQAEQNKCAAPALLAFEENFAAYSDTRLGAQMFFSYYFGIHPLRQPFMSLVTGRYAAVLRVPSSGIYQSQVKIVPLRAVNYVKFLLDKIERFPLLKDVHYISVIEDLQKQVNMQFFCNFCHEHEIFFALGLLNVYLNSGYNEIAAAFFGGLNTCELAQRYLRVRDGLLERQKELLYVWEG